MSEIIVQKFGGTSVGSVDRIDAVAEIIKKASKRNKIIVVVSAMSGETNKLVNLANHFGENPDKREFDALVSTGETISSALLAMALHSKGVSAKSYSASQISMKTTDSFSKAKILDVDASKILSVVGDGVIPIITGFQGITEGGDITTLGRGGSDTTAVAIAAQVDKPMIISNVEEAKALRKMKKAGVVSQSTQMLENVQEIMNVLMEKVFDLRFINTNCFPTRRNHQQIKD